MALLTPLAAALIEGAVSPRPPLPPVENTAAVARFLAYVRASPPVTRAGMVAGLLALELVPLLGPGRARLSRLKAARRDAFLEALRKGVLAGPLAGLEGIGKLYYYGDDEVMRRLGYDASARIGRLRELRAAEGRW